MTLSVRHVQTQLPGWYTHEYLVGRRKRCKTCRGTGMCARCMPEQGASVRLVVPVTSKSILQQLRDKEAELTKLYGAGVRIQVTPKLEAQETLDVSLTAATDQEQVAQYVAASLVEGAKCDSERLARYLVKVLSRSGHSVRYKRLRLLYASGRDILSFKKVKLSYQKLGLVLLKGVNKDWPGHSVGSGKTNLLSLLTVVLFGQTFKKGQKNEHWARERRDTRSAWGRVVFRDEQGRKVEVMRGRPHSLSVYVDGKEQSSGLTGKTQDGSQGYIEKLSGYDLRMLKNAIYIDQTATNEFVFGTQKDRMDLLHRILDLDRYAVAQKLIKGHRDKLAVRVERCIAQETTLAERVDELREELRVKPLPEQEWAAREEDIRKEIKKQASIGADLFGNKQFYTGLAQEILDMTAELSVLETKAAEWTATARRELADKDKAEKLLKAGNCPTCGQAAKQVAQSRLEASLVSMGHAHKTLVALNKAIEGKRERLAKDRSKLDKYQEAVSESATELAALRRELQHVAEMSKQEAGRNSAIEKTKQRLRGELRISKRKLKTVRVELRRLDAKGEMLEHAYNAMGRNGMPLYLAASLCPVLNKAADEYSDVFAGGKIKLLFQVIDKEFQVEIVNSVGSERSSGQSVGESALAGLIAAFALRDTAPKTNLLVLDEPGSGLDAQAATQFAQGLLKLKKRYESIIVVTHNPIIESQLAGETQWTVEKHKGISRLLIAS